MTAFFIILFGPFVPVVVRVKSSATLIEGYDNVGYETARFFIPWYDSCLFVGSAVRRSYRSCSDRAKADYLPLDPDLE